MNDAVARGDGGRDHGRTGPRRMRLDALLCERGLLESRERARRLILAGQVRVKGQRETKAARLVEQDADVTVVASARYVGRGGEKLEGAFAAFGLTVRDRVCLDVGASTGGFTDCLLQHGARRVVALDVGHGQLHWKLRSDPRVTSIEGVNARYITAGDLPEIPDVAVVDVSFISLRKIFPALAALLPPDSELITLIKPQFEAGRAEVGRGGVVRDPKVHARVVAMINDFGVQTLGWRWLGSVPSPLTGPSGNVEFLAYWRTGERREVPGEDDRNNGQS